jgi:hypothetical protein
VLEIQSRGQPLIQQEDCIQKNISVWGINIWLWVLELRKKKGSYWAVFEAVEGKLLCLKFNLEASLQSNKEDCIQKNISVWGINISLWVLELRKKKGSYWAVFEAEGKLSCLKFNLEASLQSNRKIASRTIYQSGA